MKCPKCHYLGFETGDRCRNCGYDFSLITSADSQSAQDDLILRPDREPPSADGAAWLDVEIDTTRARRGGDAAASAPRTIVATGSSAAGATTVTSAPAATLTAPPPERRSEESSLPLFSRTARHEDEPLVTLPAAPRAPLAVRRTPDTPRLRTPAPSPPRRDAEPGLQFSESATEQAAEPRLRAGKPAPTIDLRLRPEVSGSTTRERTVAQSTPTPRRTVRPPAPPGSWAACGAAPRALAAAIDLALLAAIDLGVVYFTLRMAGLAMADWRLLPPLPLLAFLVLVKLAYYSAFTAFGGQTIGKMAARIRVVADDNRYLEPGRAVQRTLAGVASVLTLGAGFAPALVGPSRRALHDRIAHTRVVALPSA